MIGQGKEQSKPEVRVAGVDQSLTGTAICCLENKQLQLTFLPETKLTGAERLLVLRKRLFKIIDAFHPELVALEGYSYDSIGRVFELGEWGGVIKLELFIREIPLIIVPPKRLKKFVGVKRDDKELMIAAVKQRYKFDAGTNDNLADAAALAKVAEVFLTKETKYRSELEVIRDMQITKVLKKHGRFQKLRRVL